MKRRNLRAAAVACLALLMAACSNMTAEERQVAYRRYLEREERGSMARWELGRSGQCDRLPKEQWSCRGSAP